MLSALVLMPIITALPQQSVWWRRTRQSASVVQLRSMASA
jgi:hypothetical protein